MSQTNYLYLFGDLRLAPVQLRRRRQESRPVCCAVVVVNAYRMKTRHKGFGAPGYQFFDFKPFIFYLIKDEERSAWGLKRTTTHVLTALTDCTSSRSFPIQNYGENYVT